MLKLKEDLLREAIKIDTPVKSQIASDWYTVEKFPGGKWDTVGLFVFSIGILFIAFKGGSIYQHCHFIIWSPFKPKVWNLVIFW